MKKSAKSILFILFLFISSVSQATNIEWHFTNSGETWSNTDTVVLTATLKNIDSETLMLGNLDTGINGAGIAFGSFDATWPSGEYEFFFRHWEILIPTYSGPEVPLLPGDSIDFIFGEFVPKGAVTPGTFTISSADLTSRPFQFESSNLFTATIRPAIAVSEPRHLALLGILILMNSTRVRRKASKRGR